MGNLKNNNLRVYSQAEYEHYSFAQEPFKGVVDGIGYASSEKIAIKDSLNQSNTEFMYEISELSYIITHDQAYQDIKGSNSIGEDIKDFFSKGYNKVKEKAGEIADDYQKWYFENVTCKNTSDLYSFPYDARGQEIYDYWALGYGGHRILEDNKIWTEYMSNNGIIRETLEMYAEYAIYEMEGVKYKNFGSESLYPYEIQNGYLTGYEMLHGAHAFNILNYNGRYDEATKTYIFDFSLEWKDKIDPNYDYEGDNMLEGFVRKLNPNAKDYDITIRWKQQIKIKRNATFGGTKIEHSGRRIPNRRLFE